MPFTYKNLKLPGVVLIEPKKFEDPRGFLAEIYKEKDFRQAGVTKPIIQINYSKSAKNVLRGLHYQKDPMSQGKMMQVIDGEIFDVAVDIRLGSPTYGKWIGENLSSDNLRILYIPEGFAHGFCVLSGNAMITYYCTNTYAPEYERGIIWNDPDLNIDWPIKSLFISERDAKFPSFKAADNNFVFKTPVSSV